MFNKIKKFFLGDDSRNFEDIENKRKKAIGYMFFIPFIIVLVLFGFLLLSGMDLLVSKNTINLNGNFINISILRAMFCFSFALLCIHCLSLFKKYKFNSISFKCVLILFAVYFCGLFYLDGHSGIESLWMVLYPLVSITLIGLRFGLTTSILTVVALLSISIFSNNPYEISSVIRLLCTYILITIVVSTYIYFSGVKYKLIKREELISGLLDETEVFGYLLLDKKLNVIKHSKKVHSLHIFKYITLYDNFIEKMSSNLDFDKTNKLRAFFDNLPFYDGIKDRKLIQNNNPIGEVSYRTEEGVLGTVNLEIGYRKDLDLFIIVFEDTTEKHNELKNKIKEQENNYENLKKLLDLVLNYPHVLVDIEKDLIRERQRIKEIFENKELLEEDRNYYIRQRLYVLKSCALILGVDSLVTKVHMIETRLKEGVLTNEHIEDVYSCIEDYSKFCGMVTSLGQNIKKEDATTLNFFLQKIVQGISSSKGKKLSINLSVLSKDVFKTGALFLIKKLLIQLLSNTLYHGIETESERESLGKSLGGNVTITMDITEDNQIEVIYSDDGHGIDITKLKNILRIKNIPFEDDTVLYTIFNRDFSLTESKSIFTGHGIGLSYVDYTVKKHNGSIDVINDFKKGLTFKIRIPIECLQQ